MSLPSFPSEESNHKAASQTENVEEEEVLVVSPSIGMSHPAFPIITSIKSQTTPFNSARGRAQTTSSTLIIGRTSSFSGRSMHLPLGMLSASAPTTAPTSPPSNSVPSTPIHFKSERPSVHAWDSDNENEAKLHASGNAQRNPTSSRVGVTVPRNTESMNINMEPEQIPDQPAPPNNIIQPLLHILIVPIIMSLFFLLPPLYTPSSKAPHTYVFLFTTVPLISLCTTLVYTVWSKAFICKTFRTPIIPCIVIFTLIPLLCLFCSPSFPLKGMGLICFSSYTITIPLSFFIRWKIAKVQHLSWKTFLGFCELHLFVTIQYLVSVGYLLLIKSSSSVALQFLEMIVFSFLTCVIKMIVLDITRCNAREAFHSLVAFWIEMYYEMFCALSFPYYHTWTLFFLYLVLRSVTSLSSLLMLTENWWYTRGWFLKLAESKTVTPVERYKMEEFGVGASMSFNKTALSFKKNIGIRSRERKYPLFRVLHRIIFTNMMDRNILISYSLKIYSTSTLAQIYAPLFYLAFSLYMRFSYNAPYLPYNEFVLNNHKFYMSFGFSIAAVFFGILSTCLVGYLMWSSYRARLVQTASPLLWSHKMYFTYATVSVLAYSFTTVVYHMSVINLPV